MVNRALLLAILPMLLCNCGSEDDPNGMSESTQDLSLGANSLDPNDSQDRHINLNGDDAKNPNDNQDAKSPNGDDDSIMSHDDRDNCRNCNRATTPPRTTAKDIREL